MSNLKEEIHELIYKLQKYDYVFYKLIEMGTPVFDDSIPTACVSFDEEGHHIYTIRINESFWNTKTVEQKLFILSHECLHILLNFGIRAYALPKNTWKLFNIAQDVVINEQLVNAFGFNRSRIDPQNVYCWIDTVFPRDLYPNVLPNKSAEYYYNLLLENSDQDVDKFELVDIHGPSGGVGLGGGEITPEDYSPIYNELSDVVNPTDVDALREKMQQLLHEENKQNETLPHTAGSSAGNFSMQLPTTEKVKKKKKWETVIKKWTEFKIKEIEKARDQWIFSDRRMRFLPDDYILPSSKTSDETNKNKDKQDVWFFQDTSGSCLGFASRFFKAARSIPSEKFNVRMFCFDTAVYETTLESGKLYGFGGTTFTCIDRYIENELKSGRIKKYPYVWVITDGYGNIVKPRFPKKWFWFLSCSHVGCIPKESKVFKLSEYE